MNETTQQPRNTPTYREVTGGQVDEFWKPSNIGDTAEGVLITSFDSTFGKCYVLEVNGRSIGLPSHTTLVNKLMKVRVGDQLLITYKGKKPNKDGTLYIDYTVQVAEYDNQLI
jgi:hypothetical protein